MTSDDHPLVITPDMVRSFVRTVDVTTLTRWEGPYTGDVGSAYLHLQAFGQLTLPIVSDGEVIHGSEYVQAETTGPTFNGEMAVLDLTPLGWPREKLLAAAIGLGRIPTLASTDDQQLASLLQEILQADEGWLLGSGFTTDDLDELLADDGPLKLGVSTPTVHTCPQCGAEFTKDGGA